MAVGVVVAFYIYRLYISCMYVCVIVINCTHVVFVVGCTLLDAASVVLISYCIMDPGASGVSWVGWCLSALRVGY
jgi:hypothetical protein